MSKKSDKLEEILTDVCFYYNPNLLKKEYRENMNLDRAKIKMVNKYYKNLVCLRFFYNKLFKYPNYFRNFYPETKEIKKNEALEHHIYAYLEDSDIFRNKLVNILNSIKNDLKNMKEEERINHIKEIV